MSEVSSRVIEHFYQIRVLTWKLNLAIYTEGSQLEFSQNWEEDFKLDFNEMTATPFTIDKGKKKFDRTVYKIQRI